MLTDFSLAHTLSHTRPLFLFVFCGICEYLSQKDRNGVTIRFFVNFVIVFFLSVMSFSPPCPSSIERWHKGSQCYNVHACWHISCFSFSFYSRTFSSLFSDLICAARANLPFQFFVRWELLTFKKVCVWVCARMCVRTCACVREREE